MSFNLYVYESLLLQRGDAGVELLAHRLHDADNGLHRISSHLASSVLDVLHKAAHSAELAVSGLSVGADKGDVGRTVEDLLGVDS